MSLKKESTTLSQRSIMTISTAEKHFNESTKSNTILVCVPRFGYLPLFTVPTGPVVLWQSFGKNQGRLTPGLKLCWSPWNRVSHIVTAASITYDAPTANVPTADNVMVNVDISITFAIVEPEIFVYKIGARNFNQYLHGKIEENVRGLVYSVLHNKVNDLRESFAESMRDNLKTKLNEVGVNMMNVKVTNVGLPETLQTRLEKTTAFQTKIEEAQKQHETKKIVLENEASKQLEALQKDNSRKLQELNAEIERYSTESREMIEKQRGASRITVTQANAKAEAKIASATGNRDVAKAEVI